MVEIGRRGIARRPFENLKNFSKITEFEFQNSGPSFFVFMSPVYCKKNRLDSNKTDGEIDFEICHSGNPPPIEWYALAGSGVQHQRAAACSSDSLFDSRGGFSGTSYPMKT